MPNMKNISFLCQTLYLASFLLEVEIEKTRNYGIH